jgi:hypothetical protein
MNTDKKELVLLVLSALICVHRRLICLFLAARSTWIRQSCLYLCPIISMARSRLGTVSVYGLCRRAKLAHSFSRLAPIRWEDIRMSESPRPERNNLFVRKLESAIGYLIGHGPSRITAFERADNARDLGASTGNFGIRQGWWFRRQKLRAGANRQKEPPARMSRCGIRWPT